MGLREQDRAIVFVVPGDLHLTSADAENYRVTLGVIDEINLLVRPDFVQFIGDNVQDATDEQFVLFRGLAGKLTGPFYALVGDHDRDGSDMPDKFVEHVGDPYGSTELRGFRFIRLNSQEVRPSGFTEDQLDWLGEEFCAARESGQRAVVFQHNYPYKVYEQFSGPSIDRWRWLVDQHRPVAIICGHTHYAQTANDGRNVSIATRSIGDPEGGAPGYLLCVVEGDDFAAKHRVVGETSALAIITHPREKLVATASSHIVHGPDEVRVRIWSHAPIQTVRYRLAGNAECDLILGPENVWSAPLLVEELSKGEHRLDVTVVGKDGEIIAADTIRFMFDPTGRYTPIPMVHPIVKETAFC